MKSALIEQGFVAKSKSQNHLMLWQDSERKHMEKILKRYGISREVKHNDSAHKSVEEYKELQDVKRLQALHFCTVPQNEITAPNIDRLKTENAFLEIENQKLTVREHSPYKSFYYSDLKKQAFVIGELERLSIPFRETDNGLEAKDCYVDEIRKIEKSYKSKDNPHRDTLRERIDFLVMQSQSFDDFLEKLKIEYTIKQGKYLAALPKHNSQYIRLKSLGAEYSEQAIRNRIFDKREFESDNLKKFHALQDKDSPEAITRKTIRQYTIIFSKGMLPMRKINKRKPFSWTNCEQLNQLALLNRKINAGATPESLRWHLANTEKSISEIEGKIRTLKSELQFFNDLYNAGVRYYENNGSDRRDYELLTENKITAENYHRITKLITDNEIAELEESLSGERVKFKDFADTLTLMEKVLSTTYVQGLVDEEKHRRQSEFVKNGLKSADSREDELKRIDKIVRTVTEPSELPHENQQYRPKRR
jgi:hypothetical protein